ncbi:MAG: GDP-mannose 4,6-dehydratase, partial [Ktedonobacterales bacterium]
MPDPTRILITGISGFVGGYLLDACRARYSDARIYGLVQSLTSPGSPGGASPATDTRYDVLVADMVQPEAVRAAIAEARPDLIFHLAAQPSVAASWRDPMQTLAINAGGAINLLEAVRTEQLAPLIVLVGSGEQYG